jgi:predicted alpha/beta superfamily hydrolase
MSAWLLALALAGVAAGTAEPPPSTPSEPLVLGETFTLESRVLNETRRINVYLPPGSQGGDAGSYPVLYLLDGGAKEDFQHIAGLVQVGTVNWTMEPTILVGIENTERRRDLTGPTEVAADREIAPEVGQSAAFRKFVETELIPEIDRRYDTTRERAVVGESLAGLFVVETFLLAPELFDTYIAVDPSLWWNGEHLVKETPKLLEEHPEARTKTLFLATSDQPDIWRITNTFARTLREQGGETLVLHHVAMPDEQHWTVFHPAALEAFRTVLARRERPAAEATEGEDADGDAGVSSDQ